MNGNALPQGKTASAADRSSDASRHSDSSSRSASAKDESWGRGAQTPQEKAAAAKSRQAKERFNFAADSADGGSQRSAQPPKGAWKRERSGLSRSWSSATPRPEAIEETEEEEEEEEEKASFLSVSSSSRSQASQAAGRQQQQDETRAVQSRQQSAAGGRGVQVRRSQSQLLTDYSHSQGPGDRTRLQALPVRGGGASNCPPGNSGSEGSGSTRGGVRRRGSHSQSPSPPGTRRQRLLRAFSLQDRLDKYRDRKAVVRAWPIGSVTDSSMKHGQMSPTLYSTPDKGMSQGGASDVSLSNSSNKHSKRESYKAQKRTYRSQKKEAAKELLSTITDPAVVLLGDWLKVRGTLKSWTKLWCVLKPGVLVLYKSDKHKGSQWVGTILLNTCQLLERPSKKDGFCFKLFHPLDQSIWATKGPKGETIGAFVQPLPYSYCIFRAPSESAGKCWMDALELALKCTNLLKRSMTRLDNSAEMTTDQDVDRAPSQEAAWRSPDQGGEDYSGSQNGGDHLHDEESDAFGHSYNSMRAQERYMNESDLERHFANQGAGVRDDRKGKERRAGLEEKADHSSAKRPKEGKEAVGHLQTADIQTVEKMDWSPLQRKGRGNKGDATCPIATPRQKNNPSSELLLCVEKKERVALYATTPPHPQQGSKGRESQGQKKRGRAESRTESDWEQSSWSGSGRSRRKRDRSADSLVQLRVREWEAQSPPPVQPVSAPTTPPRHHYYPPAGRGAPFAMPPGPVSMHPPWRRPEPLRPFSSCQADIASQTSFPSDQCGTCTDSVTSRVGGDSSSYLVFTSLPAPSSQSDLHAPISPRSAPRGLRNCLPVSEASANGVQPHRSGWKQGLAAAGQGNSCYGADPRSTFSIKVSDLDPTRLKPVARRADRPQPRLRAGADYEGCGQGLPRPTFNSPFPLPGFAPAQPLQGLFSTARKPWMGVAAAKKQAAEDQLHQANRLSILKSTTTDQSSAAEDHHRFRHFNCFRDAPPALKASPHPQTAAGNVKMCNLKGRGAGSSLSAQDLGSQVSQSTVVEVGTQSSRSFLREGRRIASDPNTADNQTSNSTVDTDNSQTTTSWTTESDGAVSKSEQTAATTTNKSATSDDEVDSSSDGGASNSACSGTASAGTDRRRPLSRTSNRSKLRSRRLRRRVACSCPSSYTSMAVSELSHRGSSIDLNESANSADHNESARENWSSYSVSPLRSTAAGPGGVLKSRDSSVSNVSRRRRHGSLGEPRGARARSETEKKEKKKKKKGKKEGEGSPAATPGTSKADTEGGEKKKKKKKKEGEGKSDGAESEGEKGGEKKKKKKKKTEGGAASEGEKGGEKEKKKKKEGGAKSEGTESEGEKGGEKEKKKKKKKKKEEGGKSEGEGEKGGEKEEKKKEGAKSNGAELEGEKGEAKKKKKKKKEGDKGTAGESEGEKGEAKEKKKKKKKAKEGGKAEGAGPAADEGKKEKEEKAAAEGAAKAEAKGKEEEPTDTADSASEKGKDREKESGVDGADHKVDKDKVEEAPAQGDSVDAGEPAKGGEGAKTEEDSKAGGKEEVKKTPSEEKRLPDESALSDSSLKMDGSEDTRPSDESDVSDISLRAEPPDKKPSKESVVSDASGKTSQELIPTSLDKKPSAERQPSATRIYTSPTLKEMDNASSPEPPSEMSKLTTVDRAVAASVSDIAISMARMGLHIPEIAGSEATSPASSSPAPSEGVSAVSSLSQQEVFMDDTDTGTATSDMSDTSCAASGRAGYTSRTTSTSENDDTVYSMPFLDKGRYWQDDAQIDHFAAHPELAQLCPVCKNAMEREGGVPVDLPPCGDETCENADKALFVTQRYKLTPVEVPSLIYETPQAVEESLAPSAKSSVTPVSKRSESASKRSEPAPSLPSSASAAAIKPSDSGSYDSAGGQPSTLLPSAKARAGKSLPDFEEEASSSPSAQTLTSTVQGGVADGASSSQGAVEKASSGGRSGRPSMEELNYALTALNIRKVRAESQKIELEKENLRLDLLVKEEHLHQEYGKDRWRCLLRPYTYEVGVTVCPPNCKVCGRGEAHPDPSRNKSRNNPDCRASRCPLPLPRFRVHVVQSEGGGRGGPHLTADGWCSCDDSEETQRVVRPRPRKVRPRKRASVLRKELEQAQLIAGKSDAKEIESKSCLSDLCECDVKAIESRSCGSGLCECGVKAIESRSCGSYLCECGTKELRSCKSDLCECDAKAMESGSCESDLCECDTKDIELRSCESEPSSFSDTDIDRIEACDSELSLQQSERVSTWESERGTARCQPAEQSWACPSEWSACGGEEEIAGKDKDLTEVSETMTSSLTFGGHNNSSHLTTLQGTEGRECTSSAYSRLSTYNDLQESGASYQHGRQMKISRKRKENKASTEGVKKYGLDDDKSDRDDSETTQSDFEDDALPSHMIISPPEETNYVMNNREELGLSGDDCQTEEVTDENKGLIWTLVKQVRPGMDLSKVVLPTFILEPRSFLDKLSDPYYHADILSGAVLEENPYSRMKSVVRWYLSGFYKKPKGLKKPYNPVIGEAFRCCWHHPTTGSRTFYIAEQVSHHPPVSVFHVTNRKDGFNISGSILARSKFYGNSLSAILDGIATLSFLERGEDYLITMPYAHCKGILIGTLTMELGGKVTINCPKTGYKCELEFKLKPFLGSGQASNRIHGKIMMGSDVLAMIDGHWDQQIFIKDRALDKKREVFWDPTPEIRAGRLKRYTVPKGEQLLFESERLWEGVSKAVVSCDMQAATNEKYTIEEEQRKNTRERKMNKTEWVPRYFEKDELNVDWIYRHADDRPWDPVNDVYQYELGFVVQTQTRHKTPHLRANSLSSLNKSAEKKKLRIPCTVEESDSSGHGLHPESDSSDYIGPRGTAGGAKGVKLTQEGMALLFDPLVKMQEETTSALRCLQQQVLRLELQHASSAGGGGGQGLLSKDWVTLAVILIFQIILQWIFR